MSYCHKCAQEFELEDGCLCAVYRVLMRDGHYKSVPPFWIAAEWDEELYCDDCRSGFRYGSPCKCGKVAAFA